MYEDSWIDEALESRLMGEGPMGNPQDLYAEEIGPESFECPICKTLYAYDDDAAECEYNCEQRLKEKENNE